MKPRPRKCKICKTRFQPFNSLVVACSVPCAVEAAREAIEKRQRRELREAKERIKTRSDWLKEAQIAFNAYIRERDKAKPCISCDETAPGGDPIGGLWDCSHYRSIGACPQLRFEELNAHKSCKQCNRDKSGNIVEYRIRLKARIGEERLEWLEGPHEPKKYTIDDLKAIKAEYKDKLRQLKRQNT